MRDKLWDPMSPELFDKCIRYIALNYDLMRFEDVALTNTYNKHKNKIATIMFDDGYKDNIEFAAPILSANKAKASFYVVTDCIDKNTPTWTHFLEHIFQYHRIEKLDLDFNFLPDYLKNQKFNNPRSQIKYVSKLKPYLKTISHENRKIVLDSLSKMLDGVELPKLMMDWNDLRSLIYQGHYIGSHTVSHCMLGSMDNEHEILSELTASGKRIEAELGYFPLTISYPVGSFNKTTKDLSVKAGYKIGLAVKQNVHDPKKEDLFEVSRIELYNEPWWKTQLRLTNKMENIKTFLRYK